MKQVLLGRDSNIQWDLQKNLDDAEKVYMPSSGANGGIGLAHIGDGEEYALFSFTSAGVVTLITNSANVGTTEDNDTTFNIFDAGEVIGFNNELGSTKNLLVIVWFG